MAESSFTQTGIDQLRALWQQFPERHDAVCAGAARAAAMTIQTVARQRLGAPSPPAKGPHVHKSGPSMADAVEVVPDLENKQFRVVSKAPGQYPANLPIWTEYGTSRQPARPYMKPGADAARPQYDRDLAAGLEALAQELA